MNEYAVNKRARFDYETLETFEGGIVLSGPEVKSMRLGHVQLQGSFLHIRNGELWLKNATITRYAPGGPQTEYDPKQDRKVLIHKRELGKLVGKIETHGLTLIPLSVYPKGRVIKLSFATARGKKQHDKRDAIKKRDIERDMRRGE